MFITDPTAEKKVLYVIYLPNSHVKYMMNV